MEKVRGTQIIVEPVEIGKTTVYVRYNIKYVETEEFTGWEYDEVQLTKDEFIAQLQKENDSIKLGQADTNTALLELTELIILGGGA